MVLWYTPADSTRPFCLSLIRCVLEATYAARNQIDSSIAGKAVHLLTGELASRLQESERTAHQRAVKEEDEARSELEYRLRTPELLEAADETLTLLMDKLGKAREAEEEVAKVKLEVLLSRHISLIDLDKATCSFEEDRRRILQCIRGYESNIVDLVVNLMFDLLCGITRPWCEQVAPGSLRLPLDEPIIDLCIVDLDSPLVLLQLAGWLRLRPNVEKLVLRAPELTEQFLTLIERALADGESLGKLEVIRLVGERAPRQGPTSFAPKLMKPVEAEETERRLRQAARIAVAGPVQIFGPLDQLAEDLQGTAWQPGRHASREPNTAVRQQDRPSRRGSVCSISEGMVDGEDDDSPVVPTVVRPEPLLLPASALSGAPRSWALLRMGMAANGASGSSPVGARPPVGTMSARPVATREHPSSLACVELSEEPMTISPLAMLGGGSLPPSPLRPISRGNSAKRGMISRQSSGLSDRPYQSIEDDHL